MKPGTIKLNAKTKDAIARWIGLSALAALIAMATLPISSDRRDVAAGNTTHRSASWHG